MEIEVRPGVESGVEFASNGNGFTNVNNQRRGKFVTVVKIKTPRITNLDIIEELRMLNEKIKNNSV